MRARYPAPTPGGKRPRVFRYLRRVTDFPPGLREEYLRNVRKRLDALALLAARLAERPDARRESLEELRREAHKIRGSAGSYGFPEATRVAGELEDTARAWLTDPAWDATRQSEIARDLVERMSAALPLAAAAAAPPPPPPPPAPVPEPARPGTPEVIVVEDDPSLLDLLEYGLRSRGYRYVVFRHGGEALTALRAMDLGSDRPLLLLDVDLPALDGYSLFEILQRERPGLFRTVFTTVHGGEEEQLRGLEAGALDYLVKPISLRVALEKIRRWVEQGRGAAGS
jgi:CheY-like chemotaxis protein